MKKQTLYEGIGYIFAAFVCLMLAVFYDFKIEPLLCGLVGSCGAVGIKLIYKYLYWSKP